MGALDARGSVVMLAVVAAAMALVASVLWLRRRPPVPADPSQFAQEPAEPWGSAVLAVFLLGPVIAVACRAIGLERLVPVALVALVSLILAASGVGRKARSLSVGVDGVEWRVLVRRRHVPLAEVVGVSNPWNPWEAPRVWLTDGEVIDLPDTGHVRVVTATLAGFLGHTWHAVPPDVAPTVWARRADEALPRRTRERFGLAGDETVSTVGSGPPFLSLVDRAGLLRACRATLDDDGLQLRWALPLTGRRRTRTPALEGVSAVEAVVADEHADEDDRWWNYDLFWGDERGAVQVISFADPEGEYLSFFAWGTEATAVIARLQSTLAASGA